MKSLPELLANFGEEAKNQIFGVANVIGDEVKNFGNGFYQKIRDFASKFGIDLWASSLKGYKSWYLWNNSNFM